MQGTRRLLALALTVALATGSVVLSRPVEALGPSIRVNFQPASAPVPAGYRADTGAAFGQRGDGLSYGWSASNTTSTRDRNAANSPDQRHDTLNHMQLYGAVRWELAVAPGTYTVRVVAGDAAYFNSVYRIDVEGVLTVDGTPTEAAPWVEGTRTVAVKDGRLTLDNAAGATNNKLAFVEVTAQSSPSSLGASPDVLALGTVAEGSTASKTVILTNLGAAGDPAITISAAAITGVDAGQFGHDFAWPVVLAPGESTSVKVTFTPTGTGVRTASLELSHDGTGSPSAVPLSGSSSGTGSPPLRFGVNFQPAGAPVPPGYLVDAGRVFGPRGDGWAYGWDFDNVAYTRERNSSFAVDQRYDTLNHLRTAAGGWEVEVPNGTYSVRLVAGDPTAYNSVYRIVVEGRLVVNGTPSSVDRFVEGTGIVTISDGRLTVAGASGASNNKIAFLEVAATGPGRLDPASSGLAFGTVAPGAFASRSVLLTNMGGPADPAVTLTGAQTSGTHASQFVATIPGDRTVRPGETVAVPIRFAPDGGGARSASVAISHSGSELPVVVSLGGTGGSAPTVPLRWGYAAPAPTGRCEGHSATIDGKHYIFGGYTKDWTLTTRSEVYDPVTNTWKTVAPLPRAFNHTGTAVDGRSVYMAGGYAAKVGWQGPATFFNGGMVFATDEVWRYDVDTDSYAPMPPLPEPRGSGALVRLGRNLHFLGGSDLNMVDRKEHWVLNLDHPSGWRSATPMPNPRSHLGYLGFGGRIYIMGGQRGVDETSVMQSDVHYWDPAVPETWTQVSSLPKPLSHISSSSFELGGKIMVIGGQHRYVDYSVRDVLAYDPVADTWRSQTPLPSGRYSGTSDVINGTLYYFGGTGQFYNHTFKGS